VWQVGFGTSEEVLHLGGEIVRSTKDVLQHHLESLAKGDLEEIKRDYAENATIITSAQGVHSGKAAIGRFFEGMLQLLKVGEVKSKAQVLDGKAALFLWEFRSPTMSISDGVDSFFIDEGLIQYQTMKT